MTARTPLFGRLAPVAIAGLLLLVAGAAFLMVGGLWLSSDPATLSLWTVLVGLLVLIGTMAILLWLEPFVASAPWDEGVPTPGPVSTPAPIAPTVPVRAMPAPFEPDALAARQPPAPATRSVERAVAMRGDLPFGAARSARASPSTSIPAAYLQSLSNSRRMEFEAWPDVAPPPIGAALPFSAAIQNLSPETPDWLESEETTHEEPKLELELARLRARDRELETIPGPTPSMPGPTRSVLSFAMGADGVPAPPTPPSSAVVGRRSCAGCGSGVETAGPAVLCWGCGRALCASCYWRFGPGPGLHRCPDCLARAPADPLAISGGRTGLEATSTVPAPASSPSGPIPSSH